MGFGFVVQLFGIGWSGLRGVMVGLLLIWWLVDQGDWMFMIAYVVFIVWIARVCLVFGLVVLLGCLGFMFAVRLDCL